MKIAPRSAAGALALLSATAPSAAQPQAPATAGTCRAQVPEAASRSGLSSEIVMRVMMAESGGLARAVSPKGAMGCMQIMPATWVYLSARYGLGTDPFDARRNTIGGALYLAELTRRYGMPGALAAYNAGPGRYERFATSAVPLPAETIAYAARIGRRLLTGSVAPPYVRWQEASLFLGRRSAATGGASPADGQDGRAGSPNQLFPIAGSRGRPFTDPR